MEAWTALRIGNMPGIQAAALADMRGKRVAALGGMPGKQAAALIAVESFGQRTSNLGRAMDTGLYLEECWRIDNGTQWTYEKLLELPRAAEAQSFLQEGCLDN